MTTDQVTSDTLLSMAQEDPEKFAALKRAVEAEQFTQWCKSHPEAVAMALHAVSLCSKRKPEPSMSLTEFVMLFVWSVPVWLGITAVIAIIFVGVEWIVNLFGKGI